MKVVLVERDIEKWFASFAPLMNATYGWPGTIVHQLDRILGYAGLRVYQKYYRGYFRAKDMAEILANARLIYKEHYVRIRQLVSSERLLNYELGSGWKPLCDFLQKEEPSVEFPWINEANALQKKIDATVLLRIREVGLKLMWPSLCLLGLSVGAYLSYLR